MRIILDVLRYIPGFARYMVFIVLAVTILGLVYFRYGLTVTLVLVGGILFIWLAIKLYNLILKMREKKRSAAFGQALDGSQGPSQEEVKAAVGDLGGKWQEAMTNLKDSRIDIYRLPWYMLVGEPQSGKSTTLKFSGLQPVMGADSISGGGGTRNCDWWFFNEGVILDTAGRFTFQESHATDSAEWSYFLRLMAKHRPFCPINGVILVIPVDALLKDSETERNKKARNISEKLLNIQKELAIQFPVYVLLTKCDQIFGFTQFFNKLNADQQREMLGWSNSEEKPGFNQEHFDRSWDQILDRIDKIRLRHLSQPHFIDDVDKTYIFPEEIRGIREPLKAYMNIIFEPNVYQDPLYFRGYFLTSGMQEGQPIVRACRSMLKDDTMLENLENVFQKSRAFFIRDFYTEKVFPEEGLVSRAAHHLKKDKFKRRMVLAINVGLVLLGAVFLFLMWRNLRSRLDKPVASIDRAVDILKNTEGDFYHSVDDRRVIYQTLKELKTGVGSARAQSYLMFLKLSQNRLTGHLQDTFSFFFLDNIMLGTMDAVNEQLTNFSLKTPPSPRNSKAELTTLLAALEELKIWRFKVKMNEAGSFEPNLEPFLDLVLDPEWDRELASLRSELRLKQEFNQWFKEIHSNSTAEVRKFIIEEMVRRNEDVFQNLTESIKKFYENQPELQLYVRKGELVKVAQDSYRDIQEPGLSPGQYHDRLMAFSSSFAAENMELMANDQDMYLSFEEIRNETYRALGPAFLGLVNISEADKKTISERMKKLLQSTQAQVSLEPERMPKVKSFVFQLEAVDPIALTDPRKTNPPGEDGHLHYGPREMEFWELILKKYIGEYWRDDSPYAKLPEADQELAGNLTTLFDTGAERVQLLNEIFQRNMFEHTRNVEDQGIRQRFEEALTRYYDGRLEYEQEEVDRYLKAIVAGEELSAPNAPTRWRAILREYNEVTQQGQKVEGFTAGPSRLLELLKRDYRRQIREIYTDKETSPIAKIEGYLDRAHDSLRTYGSGLNSLAAIPSTELSQRKEYYRSAVLPQYAQLDTFNSIKNIPTIMKPHHESLLPWMFNARAAWLEFVGAADPCPSCGSDITSVRRAIRKARTGFPMLYDEQVNVAFDADRGLVEISPKLVPEDDLDGALDRISFLDKATGPFADYLKKRNMDDEIRNAAVWAEMVRKIESGAISLSYKIEHVEEGVSENANDVQPRSLTREFTLCELGGAFKARRLNLNSPVYTPISRNDAAEDNITRIRLYNDSPGNRIETVVEIPGGLLGLMAFAMDRSQANQERNRFIKSVILPLNTGNRRVKGSFHFKMSESIPHLPDWDRLLR